MSDLTLQIAASGIEADEAELDTAAQNLSNVSTPGYAQEIVNLANNTPSATTGVGQGVTITSVSEGSSSLYDQLNLVSQGQLGAANERASIQSLAQNAFPEPSTTGLSSQLSQLWTDLSTLATQPSSTAAQGAVVQDASQVAQTLNGSYSQLSDVAQQLSNDFEGEGTHQRRLRGTGEPAHQPDRLTQRQHPRRPERRVQCQLARRPAQGGR